MTVSATKTPADFEAAIQAKHAQQLELIPKEWHIPAHKLPPAEQARVIEFTSECGILSAEELAIVTKDAGDLLADLASGKLSCLAVTTAFCKAAAVAHQLTNCLTEIFFTQALARAKELDASFAEKGKPSGALFGMPISLKDQFQIKGTECNMGVASWIGQISKENSVLVDILQDAGAILHCRTNISQALMFAESDNYVYGQSTNPFNRKLTPGGSSGGEGATVAMYGSVVGVGTDLGGSVRIPASYNGLYGLRPTLHRLPYAGARNTLLGLEAIASALGPISHSLSGVSAFVKAVVDAKPWFLDPKTPEIPWRQDMANLEHLVDSEGKPRKPVFGVMRWDDYVMPWPPMKRAIDMAVEALKKSGYEVVVFKSPFDAKEAERIVQTVYSSDGGEDLSRTFAPSGEPWHPMMVTANGSPHLTVYESWQLNQEKDEVKTAWLKAWNATSSLTSTGQPIDGLILPPSANVAHMHGKWPRNIIYTSLFNMIDYPGMVIPVHSAVDPNLDPIDKEYKPANDRDAEFQALYAPEDYAGAPITVQLVCRRFREEECIGLTSVIADALKAA
ncbi:amidase-1 [Coleophoma crateriformis]|uniref:amidase n=1 Tax=Coleophoma crateriformis TaxID=565419 RepID=A0A3D8RVN3_9HELO|nr:amidase-1 [Coleophoma crateriformis]